MSRIEAVLKAIGVANRYKKCITNEETVERKSARYWSFSQKIIFKVDMKEFIAPNENLKFLSRLKLDENDFYRYFSYKVQN